MIAHLRRSDWFLAHAMDDSLSDIARKAAWKASEAEAWYEAVAFRQFPVMLVPPEHIGMVRHLVFERHEGPITGTQIRR